MDIRRESIFAFVSYAVSAGDGIPAAVQAEVPPRSGASHTMHSMAEILRRAFTHVISPSASLVAATSGAAVALNLGTAGPSGFHAMFQGQAFFVSGAAAGAISGQIAASVSTTSNQIRKVLVTLAVSSLPVVSSLAGAGTLQFVYGSAMITSAGAVNSGGNQVSYFDLVPLPLASADEIPVGWINVPNNFAVSAAVSASMLYSDQRAFQGLPLNDLLRGRVQP